MFRHTFIVNFQSMILQSNNFQHIHKHTMKLQSRFQNTTPHRRASVGQHPCAPSVTSQLSFVVIHLIAKLALVCFHCVPTYGELHVALEILAMDTAVPSVAIVFHGSSISNWTNCFLWSALFSLYCLAFKNQS